MQLATGETCGRSSEGKRQAGQEWWATVEINSQKVAEMWDPEGTIVLNAVRLPPQSQRILIEVMTSDRKLKASRESSK